MAGVIANRISFHLSADVVAGEAVVGEEQDVRGIGGVRWKGPLMAYGPGASRRTLPANECD